MDLAVLPVAVIQLQTWCISDYIFSCQEDSFTFFFFPPLTGTVESSVLLKYFIDKYRAFVDKKMVVKPQTGIWVKNFPAEITANNPQQPKSHLIAVAAAAVDEDHHVTMDNLALEFGSLENCFHYWLTRL